MLAYMQGGMWKKQLITSFVKHLTECHKNTICIDFQVHNPKLIQEGCFETLSTIKGFVQGALRKKQLIVPFVKHFTEYDERLCSGCSAKEQTNSFFRWALYKENHENIISVCFQFCISKLSQETCFILSLLYGTINRVLYEKRHW